MYCNLKGGDGGRLYFDGSSLIAMNGDIYSKASQFSVKDVEVETSVIDLDKVRLARSSSSSRRTQASQVKHFPRVIANINICRPIKSLSLLS